MWSKTIKEGFDFRFNIEKQKYVWTYSKIAVIVITKVIDNLALKDYGDQQLTYQIQIKSFIMPKYVSKTKVTWIIGCNL